MQTGYQFRLYPTPEQASRLLRWIGCQRFIYNAKVSEDRYFRTFARKSLQHVNQHGPLDQKYAHFIGEGSQWLKEVPSVILRNGAVLWKQAYARFFKGLGGRPGIHTRYGKQAVWLTSELFQFVPNGDSYQLMVGTKKHPVGAIAMTVHRACRPPASIHVSVHAGKWFVSFSLDDGLPEPKPEDTAAWLASFTRSELAQRAIGIDLGVVIKVAASDGQTFGFSDVHTDRLARYQRRLVRWQRTAARRDKGGSNRHKANQRIARYKQAQAHIRREFAHQTSHQLVSDPRHLLFVFEALKLQNMTRSAKGTPGAPGSHVKAKTGLNRALLESALGQTRRYTEYKARRAGKLAIDVPPFNSSRECRVCGHVHQDNRLTQALFVCQACGHTENADTNASGVIQARGVDLILSGQWKAKEKKRCVIRKQVGRDSPEPALETASTPTEFSVRRETGNGLAQGTSMWEALATAQRG